MSDLAKSWRRRLIVATGAWSLIVASAQAATKERVYTMGDNDPGAVVGGKPPLVATITPNRPGTVDLQASTTDYGSVDPPLNVNSSFVPMVSFNANFAPVYVSAAGRPGAAPGSLALEFDGVNDNMYSAGPSAGSYSFDPRDFGGGFGVLAQAWVKPTSTEFPEQQFIFRIGAENGTAKISTNGFWTLQTGNTATPPDLFEVESTVAVVPNQWTHVAVVRGGNDSTLYINGSVAARDLGFWGGDGPEVTLGANSFGTDSFFKGDIDNFNVATLNGGFDSGRDNDYFADSGITFSGIAGDINQDTLVNNADYLIWSKNLGFSTSFGVGDASTLLKGDADRSGRIDLWDFRVIQQAALAAGTPLTGVPEPSMAALVVAAIGCGVGLKPRRRRRPVPSHLITAMMLAAASLATTAHAAVVVSDDFLYDGPSKTLHVGGGFAGNSRYAGGQDGPAGRWTSLWGQIGDGIITTPAYTPPNPPGDAEPNTPINAALYDGFFGVQSELFRNFDLAGSVAPTQTLYFGGRFKVDLDIGSDGRAVPQFYAPRLFLNRVAGDDRYFDAGNPTVPITPQRDRTQDIAVGVESYRNVTTQMIDNMVVARLGDGLETRTMVVAAPPSDGNWHTVIGKLELNVSGGANERLSVWLDPTGVETGGTMVQTEASVLADLNGLIGTLHSQGTRPVNLAGDPAVPTDPSDGFIDMPQELGRSYIDDMAIGTAWQDVAVVSVPRLTLRINPTTGAGRLINTTATTFALDGYSIESAAGALNSAGWGSLDDKNVSSWHEDVATANNLVETNFLASTTILPGGQLALGNLFNAGGSPTVTGRYSTGDGLINLLNVEYSSAGLAGDYDLDGRVDGRDFLVWQRTMGATVTPGVGADGNNSGKIDAGDLTVWRNNFGAAAAASTYAIPEPCTATLVSFAMALITAALCRAPRGRAAGKVTEMLKAALLARVRRVASQNSDRPVRTRFGDVVV